MQALEQGPRAPSSRRRLTCGITALVAFGAFLVLNFWPGWSAMPFFTQGMRLNIGMVDMALWAIIVFNVAYLFADTRGLRLTGHLIMAMALLLAFTTLVQDFPFRLTGIWAGVLHWILVLGVVVSFLVIPATWWGMVTQGYEGPSRRRESRHLGRHRHAS